MIVIFPFVLKLQQLLHDLNACLCTKYTAVKMSLATRFPQIVHPKLDDGLFFPKRSKTRMFEYNFFSSMLCSGSQSGKRISQLRQLSKLRSPVEVGAASHRVVREMLLTLLVAEVLQGVGPQQVAHGSVRRRLFESVQLREEKSDLCESGGPERHRDCG